MLIFPKTPFFSSQKSTLPSNLTHNKDQKKTFQTTLVILSTDLIMTWSCISYTSYVTSCQMNWDFENLVIKKLSKLGGQAGSVFSLPFGILSFLNRDQILRKSIYQLFLVVSSFVLFNFLTFAQNFVTDCNEASFIYELL